MKHIALFFLPAMAFGTGQIVFSGSTPGNRLLFGLLLAAWALFLVVVFGWILPRLTPEVRARMQATASSGNPPPYWRSEEQRRWEQMEAERRHRQNQRELAEQYWLAGEGDRVPPSYWMG